MKVKKRNPGIVAIAKGYCRPKRVESKKRYTRKVKHKKALWS